MTVTFRINGRYGYVTLDNPPVNAIGRDMRVGLLEAVERAESEDLDRVIVSGANGIFAAGADASEFDSAPVEPHLPEVLNRIEQSDVRWIAAISGAALGGGAEIALACHYRVARPDASIGFPEVVLGVVPGAGGTQRLPRLIGLEQALELIPTGKPVTGVVAKKIGLVDEVSDDPITFAEMTNSEWLGMAVPVGELNSGAAGDEVFEAARKTAARKMRGQTAPLRAVELLELSQTATLDAGMAAERKVFLDLRQKAEAKALRHIFFAERGAKAPAGLTAKPTEIRQAVVVGGGTMGAGIAYALLSAGITVLLLETDADGVKRATDNVEKLIAQGESRGVLSADKAARYRARFRASADATDGAEADLAIEAVFESMDVKKEVMQRLEAALPETAILATNTSYLDVDEIAAVLRDPSRLVGLHFFAPAHIMKLLEIVRGAQTGDQALATGFALGKRLRKICVLAGVCDGFIGNRILARYREAADTVMMDGSNPWEIDEAMVEFGYAMGPYEAQDLSGLDIAFANRRRQDATRDPNRRYVPIGDRMVNEGRLGRKVGVGWYRYPGGGGKVVDPLVEDLAREEAHFAQVERQNYTAEEIRRRLVLAMINEAADILWEGIASSASDIDLVTVSGYNFPRWRGGLLHHADTLGAGAILKDLQALAPEDALVWSPSPLIEELAANGGTFADWRKP